MRDVDAVTARVDVLLNLVVDLMYYAVDPRLRIERTAVAQ